MTINNEKENIIDIHKKELEKEGYDFSKYSTSELYLDFTDFTEGIIGLTENEKLFMRIKDTYLYKNLDVKYFLHHYVMAGKHIDDGMKMEFLIMWNIYKSKFCEKWYKNEYSKYLSYIQNKKGYSKTNYFTRKFDDLLLKNFEGIKDIKDKNKRESLIKEFSIGKVIINHKEIIAFSIKNKDKELVQYRKMFLEFYYEVYRYINHPEIIKIIEKNTEFANLYEIYKKIDFIKDNNIKYD